MRVKWRTALLGASLATSAPLGAQGPGVFEVIASRKQAATEPLLGGIALAHYHGPIDEGGTRDEGRGTDYI